MKQCFIFSNGNLLLHINPDGTASVPLYEEIADRMTGEIHQVEMNSGHTILATAVDTIPPESGLEPVGLRASFNMLTAEEYAAAGKAHQILYWDAHSHRCPSCGSSMVRHTPIMKKCPECGYEMYPQVSPAIIVRITRGEEILLVHARNFRGPFFGLVAGFVEAGESLEECVTREVMEETGLTIKNIRYFASQPWPYPSNIMIGFTAEYADGVIKLQDEELSAGAFYTRHNLPQLPGRPSIARRLIDDWIGTEAK